MENRIIFIKDYCDSYGIEENFIEQLKEFELIEIKSKDHLEYVFEDQVNDLDKFRRLFYDMEVNMEGIDIIQQLLLRLEERTKLINELQSQLNIKLFNDF